MSFLGVSLIGSGSANLHNGTTYHGGTGGIISLNFFASRFFNFEWQPGVIYLPRYTATDDPFLFDNQMNFNIPMQVGNDTVIDFIIGANPVSTLLGVITGMCIAGDGDNCGKIMQAIPQQGVFILGLGWRRQMGTSTYFGLRYKALFRWGNLAFKTSHNAEIFLTLRLGQG